MQFGIDWRLGAEYFEAKLIDYDCSANWWNWANMAGVAGGRFNRFNMLKQSRDYDAKGEYVRHWLPELRDVPDELVHQPWQLPLSTQRRLKLVVGDGWPKPLQPPNTMPKHEANGHGSGNKKGRGGQEQGRGGKGKTNAKRKERFARQQH